MTIEERALGGYPLPDEGHTDLWLDERRAYVAGANDQKRIDTGNFLSVYEDLLTKRGFPVNAIVAELARLRYKLGIDDD